jgi:hypothetical protein
MTPRTLRRTSLTVALVAAMVALVATYAPRSATAQDTGPIYLRGNQAVQDDRIQLLREEFRERQKEIREQTERAKHAKHAKQAHGRKAEQSTTNDDYAGRSASLARSASPFGIDRILVAPTNVKANDKTGDAVGAGQAEQSSAFLGLNGLCAWNDGQGFNLTPQDVQGYGWSNDGGATWTDGGIPLKSGTIATWSSDPSVTVNEKTGDFYYTGLTTNTGTNNNGVAVARGHFTAGVFGWDATTQVAAGPGASQGFDKEWMCADSSNGNLYVTWTLFVPGADNIFFSRSTNNGATWSAPLQINGTWESGLVSGSRPMVGPNGEVYVQYTAIGPVDADSVKIAKSTNGGASFSPAVVAMTEYDNYFTGGPGFNRPRAVTFASGAVDRSTGPNRGRVYMTIQDCVNFYGDGFFINSGRSEVEVNNGFANATPFTIGQTLRGSLTLVTDQDWFSFPATMGTTYLFYVDSLRTTSLRYQMRLYCPNDTTILSRLASSGAQATTSAQNSHSLIVWTAPTTNTYYLRMIPLTVSAVNGGYRILTGTHAPSGSDVARDTRDVMMSSSANGVTGWSPRVRVNDDLALYDNWLPEVAVPCDGKPYIMWFDWRDTPASCFGGTNIYLSRSTDAGATWAANQTATTATTANWTQVASNIAPNQGDYNGMYGGDCVALSMADGRLGDADVFTARITTGFTLSGCPGDQVVVASTTFSGGVTVNNLNQMFGNTYTYTVSVDRNWPGFPATSNVSTGALGSGAIPISIPVPDSAAHLEVVRVCVTVSQDGACVSQCCFNLTVTNPTTGALASLASSSAEPGHVSLRWFVQGSSAVKVYRTEDGAGWTSLGMVLPSAGYVNFEDTNVRAGIRYGYRLGIPSGGSEILAGQTWVEVPLTAEFALSRVFPNPASEGFSVSFSLTSKAPATLDIIDLSGRRVLTREVGSMGVGRHTLSLETETGRLPIGVYAIRLTQGHSVAKAKVSVLR